MNTIIVRFSCPVCGSISFQAEWEAEFDRYKAFPEWQQRRSMTLDEFKHIFFWEVCLWSTNLLVSTCCGLVGHTKAHMPRCAAASDSIQLQR